MEIKKYPHADLYRLKGLFFSIGLLTSMLLVTTAFEWKQYDEGVVDLSGRHSNTFEQLVEVPPTEIPPPPPPAVITQPRIVEVPDEEIKQEININFDVEVTDQTKTSEIVMQEIPKVAEEDVEEVFVIVEQPAVPKGGMNSFYSYVSERLHYPAQARRMRIEGRVFVEFIVNRDGSLVDVRVVKGIGGGCDEEAVRVVASAPSWNPGKQRGKPIRQRMVLPITFKLNEII